MKVRFWIIALAVALGAVLLICGVSRGREAELEARCQETIRFFGWETEETPVEVAPVALPKTFDAAYQSYEKLQNMAGFTLLPYRGRTLTRRTYRLKSRPSVELHLLLDGQTVVGGDVSNPDLYEGFLLSLTGEPEV